MVNKLTGAVLLTLCLCGCSPPPTEKIPTIAADHPANRFYRAAQAGMLSDKVCLDDGGDPGIPAAKVQTGEGYIRTPDMIPGVFRFRDTATGKNYLGVAFLQRNGFLQLPKVCSWEEKDNNG